MTGPSDAPRSNPSDRCPWCNGTGSVRAGAAGYYTSSECSSCGGSGKALDAAIRDLKDHHCHAQGCKTPCKPEMLMCLRHWRMVPKAIQRAVWAAYVSGQCNRGSGIVPSQVWHQAADAAIYAVAQRETGNEQVRTVEEYVDILSEANPLGA